MRTPLQQGLGRSCHLWAQQPLLEAVFDKTTGAHTAWQHGRTSCCCGALFDATLCVAVGHIHIYADMAAGTPERAALTEACHARNFAPSTHDLSPCACSTAAPLGGSVLLS